MQIVRTYLLLSFAALALLAAVGLYGVISYSVAQRSHELGLRSALGASSWNIILVLRNSLILIIAGLGIGLAGSLALTRLLQSLLFQVGSHDGLSLVMAAVVLAGVALLASVLPAVRATRVDPIIALRYE